MKFSSTCLLVATTLFVTAAHSKEVEIKSQTLTPTIHMLTGKGGNIGLLVGPDGTFLIDDQFAPLTKKLQSKIEELGGEAPKFVINTHFHHDHIGGNENFAKTGSAVVSHENVRLRLLKPNTIGAFNVEMPAKSGLELPMITFKQEISFFLNGEEIHVEHLPHAHTDGDSLVHFVNANVIHAGDILFNGFYPFIDTPNGGSLAGLIKAVERLMALSDDQTQIIAGHGPIATKLDLINYHKLLSTTQVRLLKLKAKGASLEEVIAAQPLKDLDAEWGDGMFSAQRWLELLYPSL